MAERRTFSHRDVCTRVGLTGRQVIDWAEKGVVRPDVADTTGAGRPRRYSEDNLVEFVLARELIGAGFTVRRAERFLRFLRHRPMTLLRTVGAIRLARVRDGSFRVGGLSFRGRDPWKDFASRPPPAACENVVCWIVLDLDAARRRVG